MKGLERQLMGLEAEASSNENVDPTVAAFPLAIGADGVTVPFHPHKDTPRRRVAWHGVKAGVAVFGKSHGEKVV